MSKLEELFANLCPDGVKVFNITKLVDSYIGLVTTMTKQYSNKGARLIYNSNIKQGKFEFKDIKYLNQVFADKNSNKKNKLGDIVTVHTGDVGTSAIINDELEGSIGFATITSRVKNPEFVNNEYLCAFLNSNTCKMQIVKMIKGDRDNLNLMDFNKILVPLPPLPIQNEIVRILDNYTELTTELTSKLTAELTARKKQYVYYRDCLLSENKNYPEKTLGDICDFVRGPFGGSLKKDFFINDGYAVYEQQHAIYGDFTFRYFIDEEKFNQMRRFEVKSGDLIMSCSGTMGKVSIIPENAPKGIINQALLKLTAKEGIDNKYLKYCFENSIASQLNNGARGGAIKNVASVSVLKEIKICVPPLHEQQRIVELLDRFDVICTDISKGIQAEIDARQKQYEYYRDKLLTFKELS